MANNWNNPVWLEKEVRERGAQCVYCGVVFTPAKVSKKTCASWEQLINDSKKSLPKENIALCCCGCKASKGQKQLSIWRQCQVLEFKISK